MVSSIIAFRDLNFSTAPSLPLVISRRRKQREPLSLSLVIGRERGYLGFCGFRRSNRGRGFLGRCSKGWEEGEGDWGLEAEILDFMQKSENPEAFPTKKQLVDAGRMDLVDGIVKQGGWLSLGWDFDDGEEGSVQDCDGFTGLVSIMGPECDDGFFRRKGGSGEERSGLEGDEVRGFGVDSYGNNSPQSASSSGRSL